VWKRRRSWDGNNPDLISGGDLSPFLVAAMTSVTDRETPSIAYRFPDMPERAWSFCAADDFDAGFLPIQFYQ
jgi:hypothetical protein